jgi:hypothetical protein
MREYTYDTNDYGFGGNEGYWTKLIDFQIQKDISDEVLNELIMEHHSDFTKYEDNEFGPDFESDYDSWLEFYRDLFTGDLVASIEGANTELLEELYEKGYINNCYVWDRHYYQTKHDFYGLSLSKPTRLIADNVETYRQDDLIELLKDSGYVKVLCDGVFVRTDKPL